MSIMPGAWRRRERDADRLDDVASLLDAGLDLEAALGLGFGAVGGGIGSAADALAATGIELDAIDRAVIDAGQTSGQLPDAIRDRARARRERTAFTGALLRRLAYPAIVLLLASVVAGWLAWIGLGGLWWLAIAIGALVVAAVLATAIVLRRARSDAGFSGRTLPLLAQILRAWGEAPYLESMRSLHGAGVPIDHAHELATRTVPVAHVRARLAAAANGLAERKGYVDSLSAVRGLEEESRRILAGAERAGTLEDAFARCATRRREAFESSVKTAVAIAGTTAYVVAVIAVVLVVLDFYGGLWSRLGVR